MRTPFRFDAFPRERDGARDCAGDELVAQHGAQVPADAARGDQRRRQRRRLQPLAYLAALVFRGPVRDLIGSRPNLVEYLEPPARALFDRRRRTGAPKFDAKRRKSLIHMDHTRRRATTAGLSGRSRKAC